MILLEASPNAGFFRLDGLDFPERNYTLQHVEDITAPSEINYTIRNIFNPKDIIINSRNYADFTGVASDAAFITLLSDLKVLSQGAIPQGGRTYLGVIDYGDNSTDPNANPVGTPIEINAGNGNLSTWVNMPNDGLGAGSINTVDGISNILDITDGMYDFSELKQGDLIRVRADLRVTTNTPNVVVKFRVLLGGDHVNAFPLEFGHRFYSSQETSDPYTVSTEFDLAIGFLLTDKSFLQVWADKSTTIVNEGVRNYLFL